jgi:hypothetical protein
MKVFRFGMLFGALAACVSTTCAAPTSVATGVRSPEPPQGVISGEQPWAVHQEWFCLRKPLFDPGEFATKMAARLGLLGQTGWEPIAFTQVSFNGDSCFLATFKAPRKE